ncbi:MAG: hypothetical protein E7653_08575 [Ruminococcaceae bacterium]|nr:hypothetical protein [Oscillospiraceae bacterium]
MNEYRFKNEGMDIEIERMDLPYPWVNYLTNTNLSAMISQAGGGFLWYKSPVKLRITRYRYHTAPADAPGFFIYIKEEDGSIWCPTFQPFRDKGTQRHATHRPGETLFYAKHGDTEARLSFFIPPDIDTLIWELSLTNASGAEKHYEVYAYTELAQFDWSLEQSLGYYWQHMLRTTYDKDEQVLFYMFNFVKDPFYHEHAPLVYFASDLPVKSYCGDRDAFLGSYRSEAEPVALEADMLGNEEIWSGNPCAVLQTEISCQSGETQTAHFYLGTSEGALVDYNKAREEALSTVKDLRRDGFVAEQRAIMRARYDAHFSHYVCDIPNKDIQRQINIWGPLNAFQFSLFHQTPQPSAPGIRAIGARDKFQALMPISYRNVEAAKSGLLFMLTVQYENGCIRHDINGYMHEFSKPGKYRREITKSDDHLWGHFLAYAIAAESNTDFLDEQIPFKDLEGNTTSYTASVWEHLMRAVEYTQNNLGMHGLPLMLDGDWNDIICRFSEKGQGESVFAAEQYVAVLVKMIELAKHTGRETDAERMQSYLCAQRENIEKYAWNGKWYYRCFDHKGKPIGSDDDPFGKIWLNPQTWAIISETGSKERHVAAYDAVSARLDTGCGLQLLSPGFATYPDDMDPFSPYNPGTGENGAIFCHAHTWSIIAEAKLGRAERAWKYYTDLLPFVLNERLGTEVYQSDPYGWVSNIVGPENKKHGWGNVIRFTGTTAWMNIAATQYLLGVRTTLEGLKLDPCIPSDWESYTVTRDYLGCRVNIRFLNSEHMSHGVKSIEVDGATYTHNVLPRSLFEGKKNISITVNMG